MALTQFAITQSSDHLSEKAIKLWLVLFRKSEDFLSYVSIYGGNDAEDRLCDLEGSIEARMLNALMKEIDDLGVGEIEIRQRSKEGLRYSMPEERMALIEEALHIVYGDISLLTTTYADQGLALSGGSQIVARGRRVPTCNTCVTCGDVCTCL